MSKTADTERLRSVHLLGTPKGEKLGRQVKRRIVEQYYGSLVVNKMYHENRKRNENAAGTSTTDPRKNIPSQTGTISCARQERGESENAKLGISNASDSFTKVRPVDNMEREVCQHGRRRKTQLTTAPIAGPPLGRQSRRRSTWKCFDIMPTRKCETTKTIFGLLSKPSPARSETLKHAKWVHFLCLRIAGND